jgi:hypothetical protein
MLTLEEWQAGAGKNLPRPRVRSDSGNKDRYSLLRLGSRVVLNHYRLLKAGKGGRMERIHTAYIGFDTQEAAKKLRYAIDEKRPGAKIVLREGERLPDYAWELKIWEYPGIYDDMIQIANNIQAKEEAKAKAKAPASVDTIEAPEIPLAILELDALIAA